MSIPTKLRSILTHLFTGRGPSTSPPQPPAPEAEEPESIPVKKDPPSRPIGLTPETWDLLTQHQRKIVSMICKGASNADIAKEFRISEDTVKSHLYRLYKILGVNSRHELRNKALRANIDIDHP